MNIASKNKQVFTPFIPYHLVSDPPKTDLSNIGTFEEDARL